MGCGNSKATPVAEAKPALPSAPGAQEPPPPPVAEEQQEHSHVALSVNTERLIRVAEAAEVQEVQEVPTPAHVEPKTDVPAAPAVSPVATAEEEVGKKEVVAGDDPRHRTMSHPRGAALTSLAAEALAAEAVAQQATPQDAAATAAEELRHRTMSRPRGSSLAAVALVADAAANDSDAEEPAAAAAGLAAASRVETVQIEEAAAPAAGMAAVAEADVTDTAAPAAAEGGAKATPADKAPAAPAAVVKGDNPAPTAENVTPGDAPAADEAATTTAAPTATPATEAAAAQRKPEEAAAPAATAEAAAAETAAEKVQIEEAAAPAAGMAAVAEAGVTDTAAPASAEGGAKAAPADEAPAAPAADIKGDNPATTGEVPDTEPAAVPTEVTKAKEATVHDVEPYHKELLKSLLNMKGLEKHQEMTAIKEGGVETYPLGGTKEMYDMEKDFEQAMVGAHSEISAGLGEAPVRPSWYTESMGMWLRTMNGQGDCYLYVHSFTQTLASVRPAGAGPYDEDLEAEEKAKRATEAAAAAAAAEVNAFPSCSIAGLADAAAAIRGRRKVPLVLAQGGARDVLLSVVQTWDGTDKGAAEWGVFYERHVAADKKAEQDFIAAEEQARQDAEEAWNTETAERKDERRNIDLDGGPDYVSSDEEFDHTMETYQSPWDGTYVVDMKPFVLPIKRTKIKFSDHMEATRGKIRRCMVAGGTLAVDMDNLAPDFENKVCVAKYKGAFPIDLFNPALQQKCTAGIFIRAKGEGAPKVDPKFSVMVIANADTKSYQKDLEKTIGPKVWDFLEALKVTE